MAKSGYPDDGIIMEPPEEKSGDLTGIVPAILGGVASIAGMIPSLMKGPQQKQLKRIQQGGGAGASVARQTASDAARRVTGASVAQPSSGRGGNLREGLRAADRLVAEGSRQAGLVAAQEGLEATRMLRSNDFERRKSARVLGAGVGQGLAGIGGMLAAARDQGQDTAAASASAAPEQPTTLDQRAAGYPEPGQEGMNPEVADMMAKMEHLAPQAQALMQQQEANRSGANEIKQLMQPAQQPAAQPGQQAQPAAQQPSPQQQAEQKAAKDVGTLADTTAGKQDAAELYKASASPGRDMAIKSPSPPPMTDPGMVQDWVYQQAMNYNPMLNQGMSPIEAEELLRLYGFAVDYDRLGMVDIAGSFSERGE